MIYIVRHGQTDLNVKKIYGGRIDSSLNETGIKEANKIKSQLDGIDFDYVFCSPLKRAVETAKIITDKNIIIDERLIERDNGDLEGKEVSSIKEKIDFNDPNLQYNIESINAFRKRIKEFYDEICEKYVDKKILVVTHAGVGIYLRCYFEGEPEDGDYLKYKLKNCEIVKYDN